MPADVFVLRLQKERSESARARDKVDQDVARIERARLFIKQMTKLYRERQYGPERARQP